LFIKQYPFLLKKNLFFWRPIQLNRWREYPLYPSKTLDSDFLWNHRQFEPQWRSDGPSTKETKYFYDYLKHVDNSSHITSTELEYSLNATVADIKWLLLTNKLDSSFSRIKRNLFKLKSCASWLQGRNNFRNIIRN